MPRSTFRRTAALASTLALVASGSALLAPNAGASSPDVVIAEVYGGGGNTGATYTNDFVELVNRGTTTVSVDGWSVQYASAAGTSWQVTPLAGQIPPGRRYLVREGAGAGGTTPVPDPDASGGIAMAGTAGKVALVTSASGLTCGASAGSCSAVAAVRDLVGYGTTASDYETSRAPAPSNTNAVARDAAGTDTDANGADFTAGTPTPEACGADCAPPPPPPAISATIEEVQGASHTSPLVGEDVQGVRGVVTAYSSNGFWIQDPTPDADQATSAGVFVFDRTDRPAKGDLLSVAGTVSEFRPAAANLSTTEITSPTVAVESTGNSLPAANVIGRGGRVPPTAVIEDDSTGNVEDQSSFDPASDGIDFYEALEGMLVQVDDAVAVGPGNSFGEIPVLADDGADATVRTTRGGIMIRPGDFNPERVILDDALGVDTPDGVRVGDHFDRRATGVLDYSFGNFKLLVNAPLTVVPGGLAREVTAPKRPGELAVATFNVENLSAVSPQEKYDALARVFVDNLRSPDIVAVEEIQDNDGPTDSGTVDASATWQRLVAAIAAAGGPTYDWRSIDPQNKTDGGQPGGNIRVGFLFRPSADLSFVDRPGGDATTPVEVRRVGSGARAEAQLSISPGRIDPTNPAFDNSRKPLAGEFRYKRRTLIVVANHWNSKGGDDPLFGRVQPPVLGSEVQRRQQADVVADFMRRVYTAQLGAQLVVAGDLNDFEFSAPVRTLAAAGLRDLPATLPDAERYTYVFDGNSQVLDHILLSPALARTKYSYDVVHVNSEFPDQVSDHEPQVVRLPVKP